MNPIRFIFILIIVICHLIFGNTQSCNSSTLKSKIEYINALGYQKQIIKGRSLSDSLIFSLRRSEDTTCINFYKIIYAKGLLLIRDDKYGEALILFTDLIDKLEKTTYKDIQAHAYISIALINELMGRSLSCKLNLDNAYKVIQKYNLKEPLTRYYVRYASYQRIMIGNRDSCYILSKKAIENIPYTSDVKDIGDAHFLVAACTSSLIEKDSARQHAIDIYYKSNDVIASLFLSFNVHSELLNAKKYKEADTYLENLKLKFVDVINENSREEHTVMEYYYAQKKEQALRNQNYAMALEYAELYSNNLAKKIELLNDLKVSKLQEEYLFEKEQRKSQEIEERKELFKKLLLLSLLFVTLLIGLLYLVLRSKRKIKGQKDTIEKSMIEVKNLNHKNEVLLSEVHHRVKNSLQNVISILQIKKEKTNSSEIQDILIDITNRVNCISLIHEQLYQNEEFENINVYNYLNNILSLHSQISNQNQSHFFTIDVDKNLNLNIDTMMPIGIIVNELTTNSIKHADTQSELLTINISISKSEFNEYQFEYRDNGIINSENKMNSGLGKILISSMVKQLNSTYEVNTSNGYKISFRFKEKATSEV